ncbi:hypothetical protein CASFOL_030591 [Castilleja foliolosa]|uniref:Photosystem II reaction center protein Z n=1 Tax=Castilleja foliolosa TaxID=1961234 RepID=A0ABD3C6D9_9LAMI
MFGKREMGGHNSLAIKGKIGPGFGIGALEDEDVYASGMLSHWRAVNLLACGTVLLLAFAFPGVFVGISISSSSF